MRTQENGKLVQRQRLIVQGPDTTMVHQGEVPLLYVEDTDSMSGWAPALVQAVNFLKSGQRQVRIWSNFVDRIPPSERFAPLYSELNRVLDALELNTFVAYPLTDGVIIVERKDAQY